MHPTILWAAALTCLLAVSPVAADEPLSPRNASYTLEATLDPVARTIDGRGTLTWRNLQAEPTDELWFHLYWNAWRNDRSTWMLENRLSNRRGRSFDPRPEDWSWIDVEAMRFEGSDVLAGARHAAPDDGNPHDRTVLVAPLPRPVAPGETIAVDFAWRSKVPRTFARTGFRGDYFFLAHWFPKLGVYEPGGWSCRQFHAVTEFYSDYGSYDVTLTLPERFVVGATGREVERRPNGDGTVSHRYTQDDVHGFTWTASPDYLERRARFEAAGLPPVDLRLLILPEHLGQAERHLAATRATLELYGRWYGPYPYRQLTVVDPAFGSDAGGMEYPTIFTSGTRILNPPRGGAPEGVTIHEAGHQFWYGVVGNDEFEHAWLDEGLNTFSTARVYDEVYGERLAVKRYFKPPGTSYDRGFLPVLFDDFPQSRAVYGNRLHRFLRSRARTADALAVPTYRYFPATAARLSYDKTSLALATLERHLGWETLQAVLAEFYRRYSFRHPEPEDFFAVALELAPADAGLARFFDQVWRRSLVFDYAVDSVASRPAAPRGLVERDGERVLAEPPAEPELFRSEVVVRRHGGGVFPVELEMTFDDGTRETVAWDGEERWRLFVVERPAKLAHAVVDPERVLLLDLDYTNNSRVREPAPGRAVAKWTTRWMAWLQHLLLTFTFYV